MELISLPLIVDIRMESAQGFSWLDNVETFLLHNIFVTMTWSDTRIQKDSASGQANRMHTQLYLTCVNRPHKVKTRIFLRGAAGHACKTKYIVEEVHLSAKKKPFNNFLVITRQISSQAEFLEINASAHL